MRHLIASLVLAATLGLAAAAGTVSIVDDGFDYADTGIESAYVQLDYSSGRLQLTLSDEPLANTLPAIAVTVPDPVGVDRKGNDILPKFADLDAIGIWKVGRDVAGFSVLHRDTDLDELADAYVALMKQMGFSATLESRSMNGAVYRFDQGGETIRAVFDNEGGRTVEAYLRFL